SEIKNIDVETEELRNIFDKHCVKTEKNLLWGYAEAVLSYIYQERFNNPIVLKNELSDDFNLSITSNHFNKTNKESI
ncbi:thymidylate synthase, partial [Vibrio parahaemolyticus]|nr:thymidylate synthase [Vibrio parahaemolyticus]